MALLLFTDVYLNPFIPSFPTYSTHEVHKQKIGERKGVIKMDATTITRVMKELMKLLQAAENYDYEMVAYEVEVLKEELGSWFIEDYKLYVGS